jgi:hypothetical protein
MQRREKALAGIVGLLVLVLLVMWGAYKVRGMFLARRAEIGRLTETEKKIELMSVRQSELSQAQERLAERGLPANPGTAQQLYRQWLTQLVHQPEIDFDNAVIDAPDRVSSGSGVGVTKLKFHVNGQGTVTQIIKFLYGFYRADHLHKIVSLSAKPQKNSAKLEVRVTIEALSLPNSNNKDQLSTNISPRLTYATAEEYLSRIGRRNFFSYNRKPQITAPRPLVAVPGRPFSYSLRAADPDGGKLKFKLDKSEAEGLKLDANGGVTWSVGQNVKPGSSFKVTVTVEDDGDPPLSDQHTFTISVPLPQKAKSPATFQHVRFAFVEALIEDADGPVAWVTVRTLDKHLKLHVGQEEMIGGVKIKVLAIDVDSKTMEVEFPDYTRKVRLGESLTNGREGV